MRGYNDISRSTSACVHFVDAEEVELEDSDCFEEARHAGCQIVYVDCLRFLHEPWLIPSEIGNHAKTDHPPYHEGSNANLVRWLDDLISLAHSTPGLVMVLDNAGELFSVHRKFATDLIEAFLIQFHHWLERGKPCHLCFQMSPSPVLRNVMALEADEPRPTGELQP